MFLKLSVINLLVLHSNVYWKKGKKVRKKDGEMIAIQKGQNKQPVRGSTASPKDSYVDMRPNSSTSECDLGHCRCNKLR